jgi:hypothetical protein
MLNTRGCPANVRSCPVNTPRSYRFTECIGNFRTGHNPDSVWKIVPAVSRELSSQCVANYPLIVGALFPVSDNHWHISQSSIAFFTFKYK